LWLPAILAATAVVGTERRLRVLFRIIFITAAGLLIPIAAAVIVFAAAGGIEGFFYWNVTHNIGYVMNPTTTADAEAAGGTQLIPFLGVTSVLGLGLGRSFARAPSRYWKVLVGGVIAASFAAASIGFRFFSHSLAQLDLPPAIRTAPR